MRSAKRQITMRSLLPMLSCLWTASAFGQDTGVTFVSPGQTVRALLPKLGAACGLQLTCADSCAEDVLVLSVKNDSSTDLLNRVAASVDGQWEAQANGLKLVRTAAEVKQEDSAEKQWRTSAISAALAKKRKEIEAMPEFDLKAADRIAQRLEKLLADFTPDGDSSARILQLDHQGPGARAAARVLCTLDAATLAEIPMRIKKVYATDPTASEAALPDAAIEAARQYVNEQTAWAQAADNYKIHEPEYHGTRYAVPGMVQERSKPSSEPSRVLFAVTPENWHSFRIELAVADAEGEILFETSDRLNLADTSGTTATVGIDAPLTLPPLFAELVAKRWAKSPLSAQARTALLAPETTDPLALGAGPLLLQAADAKHENLVAMLGDDQMFADVRTANNPPTPTSLLADLTNALYTEKEADGWLEIRPQLFAKTRRERSSRSALAAYLHTYSANPYPGLDVRSKFALLLPAPTESRLAANLVGYLRAAISVTEEPELLRFYGSLEETQKEEAETASGLPFAQLSGQQWDLLERLVYGPSSHISYEGRHQRKIENSWVHFGGVFRYPTECLPNGIATDGSLHIKRNSTSAVYFASPSAFDQVMWTLSPDGFAQAQWDRDHASKELPRSEQELLSDTTEYQVGTRAQLEFGFNLGPGTTESLIEADDQRDEAVYRFNELPSDFLQKVSDALAKMKG